MKIYQVGGSVRDELLGISPKDYDYVVVGSSPDEMLSLGYTQVGKDFPVFLHPDTGDEYALARTERKVGLGYSGFESNWDGVTLEQDLARRDLTINAIAKDIETGELIFLYNSSNSAREVQAAILPLSAARYFSALGGALGFVIGWWCAVGSWITSGA